MKKLLGCVLLIFTPLVFAQESEKKVEYPDLLVFTAPLRCPPCRKLEPVINNLEKEYKPVRIYVDNEREITRQYGVSSVPTIVILKEGVEVRRIIGYSDELNLRNILKKR